VARRRPVLNGGAQVRSLWQHVWPLRGGRCHNGTPSESRQQ
jgi:hypothetical protein